MPFIVAIEPDSRRAGVVKRFVRERVAARFPSGQPVEISVTDTTDAAVALAAGRAPDLVLIGPRVSPRDTADLTARLHGIRTLPIPPLARTSGRKNKSSGKSKRRASAPASGMSDPAIFAEQVHAALSQPPPPAASPVAALDPVTHVEPFAPVDRVAAAPAAPTSTTATPATTDTLTGAIEALREEMQKLRAELLPLRASAAERAPVAARNNPPLAPRAAAPRSVPKPIQDEWGIYDGNQCGFGALMARLDEKAGEAAAPPSAAAAPSAPAPVTGAGTEGAAPAQNESSPPPRSTTPRATVAPLSVWAHTEAAQPGRHGQNGRNDEAPGRPTADEFGAFLSQLNLPPTVAGVSYATGARIGHIRLAKGERSKGKSKS